MLHRLKQIIREFFSLSKAEQYGIIVLTVLILIFSVVYFLMPLFVSPYKYEDEDFIDKVRSFQNEQQIIRDSIQIERIQSAGQLDEELARKRIHPFPFDPNKLPDELWLKLGLTEKQIQQIKKYEAKGGKFYAKKDLKKLYCISDAEYKVLEPYIAINTVFKAGGGGMTSTSGYKKRRLRITEINRADTIVLKRNLNLPYWLGRRVVAYRTKLGGYYSVCQLQEVYGMKKNYRKIKGFISVDTSLLIKICINQVGFKQLLRHPYCNYALTKKIFNARDKTGGAFNNRNQLLQIINNDSAGLKLMHYLYICPADLRDN